MKPLNEVLSSICTSLNLQYKEWIGDIGVMSSADDTDPIVVTDGGYFCSISDGDKVIASNFATAVKDEGITETTKETAREWLLYSLISKVSNLQQ
jgi:hypothetical protein